MGKLRRFIEDVKELPNKTIESKSVVYVIPLAGLLATAGLIWASNSCENKNDSKDKLREFRENDAKRFASLKNTKIDRETIEACEKLALSHPSWHEQNLKVKCNNMRSFLESYKKISREIADEIKKKDAKKTPKAIQMRKK